MKVLFYSPYAGHWYLHTLWEGTIARALRLRGADVHFLGCDRLFGTCDIYWGHTPRPEDGCASCHRLGRSVLSGLDMETSWLGDRLTDLDYRQVSNWLEALTDADLWDARFDDLPLGQWCQASMIAHYRQPDFSDLRPEYADTLRHYLAGAALAARSIDRTLDAERPDVLVTLNGSFFSMRVALELATQRGIRYILHDRGQIDESLRFTENVPLFDLGDLKAMREQWQRIPLSSSEIEAAARYVWQRRFGINTAWFQFSPSPQPIEDLYASLGIPSSRKIISLFTTSQAEASVAHWGGPYQEQFDWIGDTIDWVRDRPDYHLVIRVHPNEDHSQGSNRHILEQYRSLAATAPANVSIIYPKDDISSYTLVDVSTAVLVWYSTVGAEAAATWGLPVVSVAKNTYSDWGFVVDLETRADYFQLLDRVVGQPASQDVRRHALRYFYRFALWSSIPFPLVSVVDYSHGRLNYATLEELAPGREPNLDRVAEWILGKGPLFPPPSQEERSRSTNEEDAFLAAHLPGPECLVSLAPSEVISLLALPDWGSKSWKAIVSEFAQTFKSGEAFCLRLWVDPAGCWQLEDAFEAISHYLAAGGIDPEAIADIELFQEELDSSTLANLMSRSRAFISDGEPTRVAMAKKLGVDIITLGELSKWSEQYLRDVRAGLA